MKLCSEKILKIEVIKSKIIPELQSLPIIYSDLSRLSICIANFLVTFKEELLTTKNKVLNAEEPTEIENDYPKLLYLTIVFLTYTISKIIDTEKDEQRNRILENQRFNSNEEFRAAVRADNTEQIFLRHPAPQIKNLLMKLLAQNI